MRSLFLLLLPLLLPAAHGSAADAADRLREGNPAAALQALGTESGAEAAYLRGRALIGLGRPQQAVEALREVPQEHALFPYAAKGLLFCAWQSPAVDVDATLMPLLDCGHADIADMAAAALAEYRLDREDAAAEEVLQRLRDKAAQQEELRPLLQQLEIADLRRRGEYEAAIELCRRLDKDRTLPLITRHRVRLALAEVYYAQEAAAEAELPAAATADDDDDAEDNVELPAVARGRGEETLLHFLSTNPESALAEEAFRRLMKHEAFLTGETARARLKEWGNDLRHPHRAALALQVQQHLLNPEGATEAPPDASCANTAAAALPNEAATATMLLEQVRRLLQRGQDTEAALYLAGVHTPSPRRDFLAACLIADKAKAARAFLDIARRADEALQPAALSNALLCALQAGDGALAAAITAEPHLPHALRCRLQLLTAAYQAEADPAAAKRGLDALAEAGADDALMCDLMLERAYLQQSHPELFRPAESAPLYRTPLPLPPDRLSEEQRLRYHALTEQAYRREGKAEAASASVARAAAAAATPYEYAVLTLHYAHCLSAEARHTEARQALLRLVERDPKGELTPRARFLAAREAELIGTLDSLKQAAALYARCAEDHAEGAPRAALRQASILLRIGRIDEAEALLNRLLREDDKLRATDKVLAYAQQANLLVLKGSEESLQAAVHAGAEMLGSPELPPRWQALTLLHHGMICTRADKHDLALGDYLSVLRMKPADTAALGERDWRTLYQAAAGATHEYSQSGRFEEAARCAEDAASWDASAIAPLRPVSARFANWARNLRKTHFLPARTQE